MYISSDLNANEFSMNLYITLYSKFDHDYSKSKVNAH